MTAFNKAVLNKAAIGTELKREGSLAMNAVKRFSADQCTAQAASIAFYSAFSLAPTLLMVIAVAGWFFGAEAARGQIFARVHDFLGNDAAAAIQAIVEHAHRQGGGGIAAIMSAGLLIVGASATFSSLNTALNVVFPALPREKRSGIALMVRVRLVSFGLVLGVAFLLVVTLVLDTAVAFVGKMIWGDSPFVIIGDVVQMVLSLVVLAFAFTALMKLLPDASVKWRDAMVGGSVAALLFTIGKKLFALYLAHAGTASAFGAAGSLAVLLMWLYFSSAVFLLGGEFAAVKGGFGARKDLREAASQKAAVEAQDAEHALRHGARHGDAPVIAAAAVPKAVQPSHASAKASGLSALASVLPRWALDRIVSSATKGGRTAGIRKGRVRASSRAGRTSPIDVWIDQSKHPVALRLAKVAAPFLLQGVSLILPMGRRRLARSWAARKAERPAAASPVGKKMGKVNKVLSRAPAVVIPSKETSSARQAHPMTAAVFAAVTGLVVAAIANRKQGD
jgi:membrane protein